MSVVHYPPPNNPLVCKVALLFHRDSRTMVNTFHVAKSAPWTLGEMSTLANTVKGWYDSNYKSILPAGVGLFEIQVRKYDPDAPLAYDLGVSPDDTGGQSGSMEAANVTLTLSWRTGLAGRAFRGRMYIPCLTEGNVTQNDQVLSAFATAAAVAAFALMTTLSGAGQSLVVFHRPHLVPRALDNVATAVLSVVVESIIDSQRKRLPGRGR